MKKLISSFVFLLVLAVGLFAQPATQADKKAEQLMKQKKFGEAIPYIEQMASLEPKNTRWYLDLGMCQFRTKKFEDAKKSFNKVIEMDSKNTVAYVQLGNVFLRTKEYDKAVEQYQKATAAEKVPAKKGQYKLMIVDAYVQKNDIAKAKPVLAELQKAAPTNVKVIYYSGEIKLKEKNWAGAKEEYNKIVTNPKFEKLKPIQQAPYYYSIGLCCLEMGDELGAKSNWKKANIGKFSKLIESRKPEWMVEFTAPEDMNVVEEPYIPGQPIEDKPYVPGEPIEEQKPATTTSSSSGGDGWGF